MEDTRFREDDFNSFLDELLRMKALDGAAEGITKLVKDKGIEALTLKQRYVFDKEVIGMHTRESCEGCVVDIPWSEMSSAVDNGGYCSWCENVRNKKD